MDKIKKLNRERKIKSKLVNTRKIIQRKFHKAKKDRMKRENKLNEQFKPITSAINRLDERNKKTSIPSIDELNDAAINNYSDSDEFMDYDDYFENESERAKSSRKRSDDDMPGTSKKVRKSRPKGVRELSQGLKKRFNMRRKIQRVRAESLLAGMSEPKRSKESPNLGWNVESDESDKSDDIMIQSNDPAKRSRLEKSVVAEKDSTIREKNNKKILEMRKVDDILMGVKNKAVDESLEKRDDIVDVSSEEDSDSESETEGTSAHQDSNVAKKRRNKIEVKPATRTSGRIASLKANAATSQTKADREGEKRKRKESKDGKGIEFDFVPYNEQVVYEHYDDPNELCERLQLLIASRAAGNSNHMQEINSIVAELREAGVIF